MIMGIGGHRSEVIHRALELLLFLHRAGHPQPPMRRTE